jgi:hypothetical protein
MHSLFEPFRSPYCLAAIILRLSIRPNLERRLTDVDTEIFAIANCGSVRAYQQFRRLQLTAKAWPWLQRREKIAVRRKQAHDAPVQPLDTKALTMSPIDAHSIGPPAI